MTVFVLHSGYPNGAWRGYEKCLDTEEGVPLVFESAEEAREANPMPEYFRVWKLQTDDHGIIWPALGTLPDDSL